MRTSARSSSDKVDVRSPNVPDYTSRVDAVKYNAMMKVLLKVLPTKAPGLTQREMMKAVLPFLPQDLWPNGEKSNWWVKTVQLDLEVKGLVVRDEGKPLKWRRG